MAGLHASLLGASLWRNTEPLTRSAQLPRASVNPLKFFPSPPLILYCQRRRKPWKATAWWKRGSAPGCPGWLPHFSVPRLFKSLSRASSHYPRTSAERIRLPLALLWAAAERRMRIPPRFTLTYPSKEGRVRIRLSNTSRWALLGGLGFDALQDISSVERNHLLLVIFLLKQ